jgi:hypothetical protein
MGTQRHIHRHAVKNEMQNNVWAGPPHHRNKKNPKFKSISCLTGTVTYKLCPFSPNLVRKGLLHLLKKVRKLSITGRMICPQSLSWSNCPTPMLVLPPTQMATIKLCLRVHKALSNKIQNEALCKHFLV